MQILQGEENTNVNKFLRSIGRNSRSTEEIYKTGLTHFSRFLKTYNDNNKLSFLTPDSIISELRDQRLNVYELLNEFVSYLLTMKKLSIKSVKLYITVIKSYLEFYDIDIVPAKFCRQVKIPKHYREDEFPLDISDIRNLLIKCHNIRLKTFLLVLASSGCRVMEVCTLRVRDVDFTVRPTRIHIRKEYTKTRRSRDVYISDEATRYLQDLIDSRTPKPTGDNLIFSKHKQIRSRSLYFRLCTAFDKLLEDAGMDEMKENSPRHKITMHSIRRWVKGVVSDQAGQDYSE